MKLLVLAAVAIPSLAQFRSIEITFQGTGCVSCAESLPERIKRIRGVESATVDLTQGVLKIALAQENRVRIEQVRDMIEQDGTKAKSATVKVQGELTKKGDKWILQPPSLPASYEVTGQVPSKPGNYVVHGQIDSLRALIIKASALQPQARLRRLNRDEYANTIRDLLNIHINVADVLPADGAGGEGFDNAGETLFLSPIHAEKYLEAATLAMDFAAKDARSRATLLLQPQPQRRRSDPPPPPSVPASPETILETFVRKAFRRPIDPSDLSPFQDLYHTARNHGQSQENALFLAFRGVLVSPNFLFHVKQTLASKLSYFLWATMPDEKLRELDESGKLAEPEIVKAQVARMLQDGRALGFTQSFVEQWLSTRDLRPDLTPDEELRGDIRYQPVLFFQAILANNLSLLNLIDSDFSIMTRKLQRLYNVKLSTARPNAGGQPQKVELPPGSHRGGVLGMSAVLAVSSYPNRTSPVLRGKWVLEALLGTPPPPPPPNIPSLPENEVADSATMRERLTAHRGNGVCAGCHSMIDPLGFPLENYDQVGRWREPIDNVGELPGGKRIAGPEALKAELMARKTAVVRNLARKMLGYALGRGLTKEDMPTLDAIMSEVEKNDYRAQTLVNEIVLRGLL
jgi:hypothetical protein